MFSDPFNIYNKKVKNKIKCKIVCFSTKKKKNGCVFFIWTQKQNCNNDENFVSYLLCVSGCEWT